MAENKVAWRLKGKWLKNCNCAPGCPCDFWANPTHHHCEGMLAMEVDEGHFGDIKMDGVKFAVTYHWPGPLHEGNGTVQPILDEKTSSEQRDAILQILSGQAGNPWFEVLASVVSTILEPKFAPIEFQFDLQKRQAQVMIPGILETITEPIKNIATGDEHRILVQLPNGMEYKIAEIASAVVNKGTGDIKYDCPNSHSSLAYVEQTHEGLRG
jgi:hypothetical protein